MKRQKSIRPIIAILYYILVGSMLAYLLRHGGSEREGWWGLIIFRGAFLMSALLMLYTLNKAMKGDQTATLVSMVHAIALFSSVVRLAFLWGNF